MSYEIPVIPLGELVELRQGFAINKKSDHYLDSEGIPLLRITDLLNKTEVVFVKETIPKQFIAQKSDIIFTRTGQVGLVFKGRQGVLHNNCFKVIPTSEMICREYLYWVLKSDFFKSIAVSLASGAAQPDLNHSAFKSIKIPCPPNYIQKRIGAVLSAYNDLIENNLKRIKLLEEMAQITYEEWFVRMKFPGHETAVFDKETNLPQGWKKKKLGDIITLNYGKALKAEHRNEGKYPVFGSAGVVGLHDTPLVKDEGIILGRKGNVGAVHWSFEHFYPIDTVYYVTSEHSLHYVYYLLKHQEFINNDAAVPGLNRNAAYAKKITLPAVEVVNQFDSKVLDIFSLINNIQRQNNVLKEARDILLPRLMTGMIDIEKVELPETILNRLEQQEDKMATAV
ncbi:restriction endonuclease subunit S [Alteromonadaceae bacterium M269]|nr:restriction endonuclease subunit S [Alteromonadaceae bacterium M269]